MTFRVPHINSYIFFFFFKQDGISVQKQFGNSVHISSDGKQLHLMHALLSNSGNYSCVAENSAGAKELLFEVKVEGKFSIIILFR